MQKLTCRILYNSYRKRVGKKKNLDPMSRYPEPPDPERAEKKYLEEKRLARLKDLKEKQDLILQRRR